MIDFNNIKIFVSTNGDQFAFNKVTIEIDINNTKKYIYGVDYNCLEQCLNLLGKRIISTKQIGYRLDDFFSLPEIINWDF